MTAIMWFLSEAAFPVSLGAAFALAGDIARRPRTVHHYRWRNRRFLKELRSRTRGRGGFGEAGSQQHPLAAPARAGGDARPPRPSVDVARPPAPCHLAGAQVPRHAAPARPPRVMVHG